MPDPVKALIKAAQPYADTYRPGEVPEHNPMAILSALDNADKHYELAAVSAGLMDVRVELEVPGFAIFGFVGHGCIIDGGIVKVFTFTRKGLQAEPLADMPDEWVRGLITHMCGPDPEMEVHFTGTPSVGIQVGTSARIDAVLGLEALISGIDQRVITPIEAHLPTP
jgi:hypothetical protein